MSEFNKEISKFRFYSNGLLEEVLNSLEDIPSLYLKYKPKEYNYYHITQEKMRELLGITENITPSKYKKEMERLCEDLGFKLNRHVEYEKKKIWFWLVFKGDFEGYRSDKYKDLKNEMKFKKANFDINDGNLGINSGRSEGVYLVESDGFYKIGKSKNIAKRISSLKTGNPNKIELLFSYYPYRGNIHELEKYLHDRYSSSRTTGEWFKKDFTVEDVKEACLDFHNLKAYLK